MNQAANEYSLDVRGELADLARVGGILDGVWRTHGLDDDMQADLNIAVEEMLSNVIRHGGGLETIHMRVVVDAENVRIEIEDEGVPFNPLAQPPPDLNVPLEQRKVGGLGIFLVVRLMNHTDYQRRNGRNCFTMVKARVPQPT